MAVPPCRSYFFELTHSISPLTVSESRGYFLFFSIANPRRRVNARGRPSVSKKPRRVCRPQAAKHCNHFLSRHVRERKYFSGCKCGLCAPRRTKSARSSLQAFCRESPPGFPDKQNRPRQLWLPRAELSGGVFSSRRSRPSRRGPHRPPRGCRACRWRGGRAPCTSAR